MKSRKATNEEIIIGDAHLEYHTWFSKRVKRKTNIVIVGNNEVFGGGSTDYYYKNDGRLERIVDEQGFELPFNI